MYYKITNKESKVFKKLEDLKKKVHSINTSNEKLIEEKVGQKWNKTLISNSDVYETFYFKGFEFEKPEDLDLKTWKNYEDYDNIFVPNFRTKKGREMKDFLNNLEFVTYRSIFGILNLKCIIGSKYKIPYLIFIRKEYFLINLDSRHIPEDENVVEITSTEFNKLLKVPY